MLLRSFICDDRPEAVKLSRNRTNDWMHWRRGESIPGLRGELKLDRSGTAVALLMMSLRRKLIAMEPLGADVEPHPWRATKYPWLLLYFAEGEYQLAQREALAAKPITTPAMQFHHGVVYSQCFSALVEMAIGDYPGPSSFFNLWKKLAELEESWRSYISAEPLTLSWLHFYEWNQMEDSVNYSNKISLREQCSPGQRADTGVISSWQNCAGVRKSLRAYAHLERAQSICPIRQSWKYQRLLVAK